MDIRAALALGALLIPAVVQADQTITLGVLRGQMRYDREVLEAKPGEKITLTLKNTDDLPHNFILAAPGGKTGLELAQKAWALGEKGLEKNYVPDDARVLAATRIVEPRAEQTITFTAPQAAGVYHYVCTYPGHAMTMKGLLLVGIPKPGLHGVHWQYFEGSVHSVFELKKLPPIASGTVENGLLSLKVRKREDNFGLIWKGKLNVPADGTYKFFLDSDDGSGCLIDGKLVVANDGIHGSGTAHTGQCRLQAGDHDVEILYFEQGNEQVLRLAMQGPGVPLQNLTDDAINPDAAVEGELDITVGSEPRIFRVLVPGGGTRTVSVGLPGGINYSFDTEQGSVVNGWRGGFLNVAGDHTGRGGNLCRILGQPFNVGGKPAPLRFGSAASQAVVKFSGYRKAAIPQMLYRVGAAEVTQSIGPLDNSQPGLRFDFAIKNAPPGPVFFLLDPAGLEISSPEGTVSGCTVEIPSGKASRFSILLKAR
ncbi:MAG: hypothetical protein KA004_11550 [Verrucomicrobiales bacterium]|nr:hypothetical protein [Verrucomicrobiales bacterium]